MTEGKDETRTWIGPSDVTGGTTIQQADEALLKRGVAEGYFQQRKFLEHRH